jgi:serine/threonine-protein kinase RsbW
MIPSPEPPIGPATDRLIDMSLSPTATAPAMARRELEAVRGALDHRLFEDLRLLVSELVANAVLHAGLIPGQRIAVRLRIWPSLVRVEVEDPGRGFRPRPARGPEDSDGRGLLIVDRLASNWGVARDDRTVVWAELSGRD